MPRKKLSEATAKQLIYESQNGHYDGVSINTAATDWQSAVRALDDNKRFVVKVDQAVKRRNVLGLLRLDRTPAEVIADIKGYGRQGYRFFVVEPMVAHLEANERYLSVTRDRSGVHLTYSSKGGVDIEQNRDSLKVAPTDDKGITTVSKHLDVPKAWLIRLIDLFNAQHMVFMELNPIITGIKPVVLDAAIEVDDAALLQGGIAWEPTQFRSPQTAEDVSEVAAVRELAAQSQASFSLELLNPDGAIFVLLAGGGASVVVADEVANRGAGDLLANYGEASGNPSADEMYVYATQVLNLMRSSKAVKKVLIIGGGVANFTDVATTFTGIIKALAEQAAELGEQHVKVFVRRGGPNEAAGLAAMRAFLEEKGLLGEVSGPEIVLTDVVSQALQEVQRA